MAITLEKLSKRFGRTVAVGGRDLRVEPGRVTGFLGPNGAGKSTTMRMILGLDRPTSGRALVGGRPYVEFRRPLREVGALLEAKGQTVFVASHLLSEMQVTADHLVVLGRGQLLADRPIGDVLAGHASLEDAYYALTADSVEFS